MTRTASLRGRWPLWPALVLAGCSGGAAGPEPPPPPPPAPVASVAVNLAPTGIAIGQTAQATANLRDAAGLLLNDRPVTWSSTSTSVATVNSSGLVTAVAVGAAGIAATAEGISGSAELQVFGSTQNLTVDNVTVTQVVQRYDGTIPLVVGGHPVLVNVFGTLDRPFPAGTQAPKVRIEIFNGAALVQTDERAMTGSAAAQVNPEQPIHQVVLPASIVHAGLAIRVTINPDGVIPEANLTDNQWPRSGTQPVAAVTVPTLPLHFVPILLTSGGSIGTVTSANLPEYLNATEQLHPVSTIDADIGAVFATDVAFGGGDATAWTTILQQLDVLRVMEGTSRYYVGALQPPPGVTFVQFGGYGYIPPNPQSSGPTTRTAVLVGAGWFNRARQTTELVAHELGHTMGRAHSPCGGASNPDPNYPYAGAQLGVPGYDLFTWQSTGSGLPIAYPSSNFDIMSYCTPAWISDYTYVRLIAARGAVNAAPALRPTAGACPCLIVWGSVRDDAIRLEPSFVAPAPALPSEPSSGAGGRFFLSVGGSGATPLAQFRFDPVEIDHAAGIRHFLFAIPFPANQLSGLSLVSVSGAGLRAERTAPLVGSPPSIRVESAGSATLRLRWDGETFPLLVIRDPRDGRILQLAQGGTALIARGPLALDLTVSDGVRSTVLRVMTSSGGFP